MTPERQARVFNSLLADVEQSLKAREQITRYLSRAEVDMLTKAGYEVYYHNPRGQPFVSCRISKAAK